MLQSISPPRREAASPPLKDVLPSKKANTDTFLQSSAGSCRDDRNCSYRYTPLVGAVTPKPQGIRVQTVSSGSMEATLPYISSVFWDSKYRSRVYRKSYLGWVIHQARVLRASIPYLGFEKWVPKGKSALKNGPN
jgi:hypothetical protein